jgi:hypothetical protein
MADLPTDPTPMTRMIRPLLLPLAALLLALPLRAQSAEQTYAHAEHGWSIAHPAGWVIDTLDTGVVQLRPPAGLPQGIVGVHQGALPFLRVDELVDLVIENQAKSTPEIRVLDRRTVYLADSLRAIELDTELEGETVSRSRRLFVVSDDTAYIVQAETRRDDWDALEPYFARILQSFRVPVAR